ncbi:MAG: Rpn family recombination-promoting nuclease/putative transposase [Treponema sp.]|nr:Rpn family recombination-promoting nuclease/putative transposase [Treponema sp.]
MGTNAQYKDSVFSLLFSEPETLRELYSAIEGVPVDPAVPVTINTLQDVLYMERYNDISFTLGNKLVILIEHQSSINPNMPLRILLYIAGVYEKIIEQGVKGSLYREKLIMIPYPVLIVLYNGTKPYPDQQILRLSDAFEDLGDLKGKVFSHLELMVKMYNINQGHNEDILQRCVKLKEYSTFIEKIRENRKTQGKEEALKAAINYCIDHQILRAFLIAHSTEVRNMLSREWNWDEAKEIWQEEAWEEGREEGREEGKQEEREKAYQEKLESARKFKAMGFPVEQIAAGTGLSAIVVAQL